MPTTVDLTEESSTKSGKRPAASDSGSSGSNKRARAASSQPPPPPLTDGTMEQPTVGAGQAALSFPIAESERAVTGKFKYGMICSSNMNRSMEAHVIMINNGMNVESYGCGR